MYLNYTFAALLIGLGLYCLLVRRNLIKMVMGLSVLTDGIHLFLISLGYRTVAGVTAPIYTGGDISQFAAMAVDPLPQALVLTSIVINVSVLAFALSLAIYAYRHFGTLDVSVMRRLRE
ncbi:MAG: NADH-quinone oxidoreductase subunit K [Candidatus Hadarchaeales archaeon]